MSYRERGADLIFDPNTTALKLMLDHDGKRRPWSHVRTQRKPTQNVVEGSLVWTSWHGGAGYARDQSVGFMQPVTADGDVDARHTFMAFSPPAHTAITGTDKAFIAFEYQDKLWVADVSGTNVRVKQIDPADFSVDADTSIGSTATRTPGPAVVFDGVAYIPVGFVTNAYQIDGTLAVTQLPTTGAVAPQFSFLAPARDRLYFSLINNVVRSISTGGNLADSGDWSGEITIGDDSHAITSMNVLDRTLLITKTNGLYGLDSALNQVDLIPELGAYVNAFNGRGSIVWHGGLLMPHIRGLYWYRDGTVLPVGPETIRLNGTYVRGVVTTLIPDGEWVYALMRGVPKTGDGVLLLLAARERTVDDPPGGPLVWYLLKTHTGFSSSQTAQGSYQGVLTSLTSSPGIFYGIPLTGFKAQFFPVLSQNAVPVNPTESTTTRATGELILPIVNMGQPMIDKYLRSVEVDLDTSTAQSLTVSYALNPATTNPTWTSLGSVTSTGRTELAFPTGTSCREVIIKIATPAAGGVIKRIALNYTDRPKKNTIYTAVCRVAQGQEDAEGTWTEHYVNSVVTQLETWEDQATAVSLVDPYGDTINVLVLDVKVEELETNDSLEDAPAQRLTLVLEKVP
jgi:hypothetical protein